MSDLTDFLLARIAEDEVGGVHETTCGYRIAEFGDPCDCGWDKRMLADCEAKRRIVARHKARLRHDNGEAVCLGCGDPVPCPDLRDLASVYADHPDYREEWKP